VLDEGCEVHKARKGQRRGKCPVSGDNPGVATMSQPELFEAPGAILGALAGIVADTVGGEKAGKEDVG